MYNIFDSIRNLTSTKTIKSIQLPDFLYMTLWRKEVMKNNEESKRKYIKIKIGSKVRRIYLKKDQTVLISNKLIQSDKQKHYLNYYKLIILKKGDQKEHFKVKGKVIEEKRNYCKVIIMSS